MVSAYGTAKKAKLIAMGAASLNAKTVLRHEETAASRYAQRMSDITTGTVYPCVETTNAWMGTAACPSVIRVKSSLMTSAFLRAEMGRNSWMACANPCVKTTSDLKTEPAYQGAQMGPKNRARTACLCAAKAPISRMATVCETVDMDSSPLVEDVVSATAHSERSSNAAGAYQRKKHASGRPHRVQIASLYISRTAALISPVVIALDVRWPASTSQT
jgi:hypothetical protein